MNINIPPAFRPYAFALLALAVIAGAVLVIVALITGHDLSDPHIAQILGYLITIVVILISALGLSNQVAAVHTSINGRMTELVDTTASSSFQAGQSAGPSAPVPPPPSTQLETPQ
jgi:hypothetical protein